MRGSDRGELQRAGPVSPGNVGVGRYFCGGPVVRRHFSGNVSELTAFWVGGFRVRARLPVSGSTVVGDAIPRAFVMRACGVLVCVVALLAIWSASVLPLAAQQNPASALQNAPAATVTDSPEAPQIALCTGEPDLPPVV